MQAVLLIPVQGLDPKSISDRVDLPAIEIEQQEGEHPVDASKSLFDTELAVKVEQDLGVRAAAENASAFFEFWLQIERVVDLPVEVEDHPTVWARHWLMAVWRQV